MKLKLALIVVSAFTAFCLITSPAHAQNVYAAIHGTVTDATGAVVPDASVTIVNTSTNISNTATSDSKGFYTFPQLQIGGPYSVTITAPGFQSFKQNGLTLRLNDNREINASLQVGSGNTTVSVSASAVQVETADTQLKQVMTTEQLESIPLEGRDAVGLQKLDPGVVESSDRFGTFATDGSQSPQNAYLVDGVDISDSELQSEGIVINPDALQEEDVVASTLNPEFARNSGATINQVVKAGTNQFHGDGFEFYRDTFLNDKPYFATVVPKFHQNLYGGTVGGPLIRDKLFFFLGYQGLRNVNGQPEASATLSNANYMGNFSDDTNFATGLSNSSGLTGNPIPFAVGSCAAGTPWNQCFPTGGAVSVAPVLWNPISSTATSKYIPPPNQGSFFGFNISDPGAQDQGVIRVDYTPTSRDTIWASSVFQSSPFFNTLSFGGGTFPGFGANQAEHFKIFSASYTHTFNANTLNELRAGFYRLNFASVEPATPALPSSYGFTGIAPQNTVAPGYPYTVIGSFAIGNSFEGPQPSVSTNATYSDNFTKILGSHTLKIGASYEQLRVDNPFDAYNNGRFIFGGGGIYSSGDPILDFELGIPDSYVQSSDGHINAIAAETYAYAQDSWKMSTDLTVNYGIAWDVESPNKNNQFAGLGIVCWTNSNSESKIFPGAPPGLNFPGDSNCNNSGGPTPHYDRIGPRVGVAWSPSNGPSLLIGRPGSHDFSIRAGYGIYYNRDQEEQSLQNLEDPPFFFISFGAGDFGGSPSFANPFADIAGNGSETNPFPFAVPTPGDMNIDWPGLYSRNELATFDRKLYSVPYAQNFNLNIQRALPSNMILQLGYVGSVGHRLATWYEGDPITPAGHAACLAGATVNLGGTAFPCNSPGLLGAVHTYFPQFTADPAIVPGTGGGAIPQLPNGLPWYLGVGQQTTEGSSNYNSLQFKLIKAPTHGLYTTFAYTYSHSLDNSSGYESATGQGTVAFAGHNYIYTPGFGYLNYGDSDFDARQRFVSSYIYRIPVLASIASNPILRMAIAGWEVGGVTTLQTGYPVSFSQGSDRSLWCDGSSYFGCGDTPETSSFHLQHADPRKVQTFNVGGVPETGHFFLNPEPFSPEPVGTFGNVKRNFFHGPGFNYTNLQLSKNFMVSPNNESRYIQLRIEAFNAFNHANFFPPGSIFNNASSFGQISTVDVSADVNGDPSPARAFQLVGKFYF